MTNSCRIIEMPTAGSARLASCLQEYRVCFLGEFEDLDAHIAWLDQVGVQTEYVSGWRKMNEMTLFDAFYKTILVVDAASLGSFPLAMHKLGALRDIAPQLPIVLFSEYVERDDMSNSSIPYFDVLLKKPMKRASIELGLLFAPLNNVQWQIRWRKCHTAE